MQQSGHIADRSRSGYATDIKVNATQTDELVCHKLMSGYATIGGVDILQAEEWICHKRRNGHARSR